MSTQAMAAFHSVRSMAEGMALGISPTQALVMQLNHLSYAASGPGGVTGAFKELVGQVSGFVTPGRLVVAGFAAVGVAAYGVYRLLHTEAPTAVEILKEHARVLDVVKEAYAGAKGGAERFYEQSKLITQLQAQQNLIAIQTQMDQLSRSAISSLTRPTSVPDETGMAIEGAINNASMGETKFNDLNRAIQAFNDSMKSAADINTFRDAIAAESDST